MESRNCHSKLITKIELDNGEQITDQSQILQDFVTPVVEHWSEREIAAVHKVALDIKKEDYKECSEKVMESIIMPTASRCLPL